MSIMEFPLLESKWLLFYFKIIFTTKHIIFYSFVSNSNFNMFFLNVLRRLTSGRLLYFSVSDVLGLIGLFSLYSKC